ncbi:DUF6326 family protein [Oryzibacter oryziterrae]|uniref:DUF6326 family protein n=1 Tax=Oryzibacter oryziterrae TaxID=2766474 RepID=UPI001F47FF44|nr:DUF6326 family protein [Oryzibacter oryziterrae]
MNTFDANENQKEKANIDTRLKLASLWTCFMFMYIYVDYFHLYMPSSLNDILSGKVFEFEISQAFLLISMISVTVPALMIPFSLILPASVCRRTNIIAAIVYIPYTLFNLVGEAWIHMVFAAAVEVVLLLVILRHAWIWPRVQTGITSGAAAHSFQVAKP